MSKSTIIPFSKKARGHSSPFGTKGSVKKNKKEQSLDREKLCVREVVSLMNRKMQKKREPDLFTIVEHFRLSHTCEIEPFVCLSASR